MQFIYQQMHMDKRKMLMLGAFALSLFMVVAFTATTQFPKTQQAFTRAEPPLGGFHMGVIPAGGPQQPDFKGDTRLLPAVSEDEEISDAKTLSIKITIDGATSEHLVANGTIVETLLQDLGIVLGEYDRVTPTLNKTLRKDSAITIRRVVYENATADEVLPFETVYRESSLLKEGKSRLVQEGKDGSRTVDYVRCFVDGELESEIEQQVTVHSEPLEEIIVVGADVAISPLEFEDIPLGENGVPVEYQQVLTEQVATGYSARRGAKTASGRDAIPGHVAVDPKDIPYGSRLYITSSDNSFIYGYAIAADTGVGLMQDVIDVDLFYDTYRESAMNGRKIVNIYVLE